MASSHIRFNEDIDEYEPSDSEAEYTEKEKLLLKKSRTKQPTYSDSEEEVYGLEAQDSEDDGELIAESDIEGQDEDDLPDVRAWGKSKRDFYSTDYVDQDYGGFQGKDAAAAEFEEEEAKNIQKRLTEQLDDDDFALEMFNKKPETEDAVTEEELIKSDLSTLSKRELSQLLRKESPEFFVLVDDFKVKMTEIKSFLAPIIIQDKEGKVSDCEAMDFVKTMYHLILNYCSNIYMYLLLKSSKANVQNHPILKRLYQYRQLIAQLEPTYNEIIKPQIEIMIEMSANEIGETVPKSTKVKKLKLLQNLDKSTSKKKSSDELEMASSKKAKLDKPKSILKTNNTNDTKSVSFDSEELEKETRNKKIVDSDSEEDSNDEDDKEIPEDSNETSEGAKRAITYQMKKNKGLTPHRKKEQRNPRVKHRNKFRKANIRRKGAVREVRTETSRYGGEMSGIKATVSKSIKIK